MPAAVPVTYGEASITPRGDYAAAAADYSCAQRWESYTSQDHDLYARLHARQRALLPGRACGDFIAALDALDCGERIPRFADIDLRLRAATGWELAAVPGLIPEAAFFALLAARRFPVTVWMRRPEEADYIVEPDLFHDLFGHVPMLFEPRFADYMQAYGAGGVRAAGVDALRFLARLYWYTVEFGLVREAAGLRAYGAGILSSPAELVHAVEAPGPRRLRFDLGRIMRSRYRIDNFQQTYFVIDGFDQLIEATAVDFASMYRAAATRPDIAPGEIVPGDCAEPIHSSATQP